MRVISGDFKGKKILEPKDIKTRPLKDLTKESIFNILKHSKKFSIKLENSEILDLFSGTGSFGMEWCCRYYTENELEIKMPRYLQRGVSADPAASSGTERDILCLLHGK